MAQPERVTGPSSDVTRALVLPTIYVCLAMLYVEMRDARKGPSQLSESPLPLAAPRRQQPTTLKPPVVG